ncbi:hypothetical protein GCM10010358_42770 [Streptomyces minutiscleroticus]|uniref:Uncharacterized protein n=1 Tax=Streptomyces minutiscleroticus TaxID=68238 RepID=A0A918U2R9_9ACTN|nr:hypothetical protein GCM10010358_42770 [Streptomyces minutiscleroticus]
MDRVARTRGTAALCADSPLTGDVCFGDMLGAPEDRREHVARPESDPVHEAGYDRLQAEYLDVPWANGRLPLADHGCGDWYFLVVRGPEPPTLHRRSGHTDRGRARPRDGPVRGQVPYGIDRVHPAEHPLRGLVERVALRGPPQAGGDAARCRGRRSLSTTVTRAPAVAETCATPAPMRPPPITPATAGAEVMPGSSSPAERVMRSSPRTVRSGTPCTESRAHGSPRRPWRASATRGDVRGNAVSGGPRAACGPPLDTQW